MIYQIVESNKTENLVEYVNNYIRGGWEPLGGICVDTTNGSVFYYQAMIKKNA